MAQQAAQKESQMPQRAAELDALEVFLGEWHTTGEQIEGTVGAAAPIDVRESYEWLDGKYFLIHHFKGDLGGNDAACIEIIGYDGEKGVYIIHTYYNNGVANDWQMTNDGDTWTISGKWPMKGETMKVRCTIEFSDAGNAMDGNWEMSADGKQWQTFWDVSAVKENQPAA
jgi:Protein of unknown function (DUF1579)